MSDKLLVGLYDTGIQVGGHTIPSLDLAKYSAFHKSNNDIVRNLRDLKDTAAYDVIYVHSSGAEKRGTALLRHNVRFVESAPRVNTYLPLPPQVEATAPDFTYYTVWDKSSSYATDHVTAVTRCIFGPYHTTRLTFYGEEVNHPKVPDGVNLLLYDVGIGNSDVLLDLLAERPETAVAFTYRQLIPTLDRLERIMKLRKHHTSSLWDIVYDGPIDYESYVRDFNVFTQPGVRITLPTPASFDDVINVMRHYLNMIFYAKSKGTYVRFYLPKVTITCIDSFSVDTLWDMMMKINNKSTPYKNGFDYLRDIGGVQVQKYFYNETDLAFILKILEPQLRFPLPKEGEHFTPIWEYGI